MNWATGVTTCPRKVDYLPETLLSLHRAGWTQDVIYTDQAKQGAWKSFRFLIETLLEHNPTAQAYLVAQDDALFARGLREWLEHQDCLWNENTGVVSLYTAEALTTKLGAWERWKELGPDTPAGWAAGAVAVVLRPQFARYVVSMPDDNGKHQSDIRLKHACKSAKKSWWLHSPSLVRHVGKISAIGTHPWNHWRREGEFWDSCPVPALAPINDYLRGG